MTLARWNNNGDIMYDKAIAGIPFLDGTRGNGFNDPQGYRRETSDYKKTQIDQTTEPGEQSLQGFWYRSQSSFHLGAGTQFFNPVTDPTADNRFQDSCGINVFTQGQAKLLHGADTVHAATNGDNFAVGYSISGVDGVLHADGTNLTLVNASGGTVSLNTLLTAAGNSTNILGLCSDGGAFYLVSASGVFRGLFDGSQIVKIYLVPTGLTTPVRGNIFYVKQQLVIAYNNTLYLGVTMPLTTTVLNSTDNPPNAGTGNNGDYYFTTTENLFLTGAIPPAASTGNNGDYYYNTATQSIYGPKTSGAWPDAKPVLTGLGAPATSLGNNADYYYNTTDSTLYGPKANGVWPAGGFVSGNTIVTLYGPKANGAWKTSTLIITGTATPPAAGTGANGQYYFNLSTNTLYGPKTAGAWLTGAPYVSSLVGNTYSIPSVTPFPFTQPQTNWTWTGAVDGPGNMFFSGYSGDQSYIYKITFDERTAAFTYPASVAELPRGEVTLALSLYLGTYLVLGTNLGVRVGIININGTLDLGALSVNSNTSVAALLCYGDYVWTGGAKATKSDASTKIGLFKLDLTRVLNANLRTFPYQRDIYAESINYPVSGTIPLVQSICNIGYSGRTAYTVQGVGLVFENATNFVANGWLDTGRIRMDTGEAKIFQSIKVSNFTNYGTINVAWRDEAENSYSLYSWNTQTYKSADTLGSDGQPRDWVTYRFTLSPYAGHTDISPVLIGYTARSFPSGVKQRTIMVPLVYFPKETDSNGKSNYKHEDGLGQLRALEVVERTGALVLYQDFGIGEERLVVIESMVFLQNSINESRKEKANPGGILVVTLRAVD